MENEAEGKVAAYGVAETAITSEVSIIPEKRLEKFQLMFAPALPSEPGYIEDTV